MRTIHFLLLFFALTGCFSSSSGKKSAPVSSITSEKDSIMPPAKDALKTMNQQDRVEADTSIQIIDKTPGNDWKDLAIYRLYVSELNDNKAINFISLTDNFPWSAHPDSQIIEDKYLGNVSMKDNHYHSLKEDQRALFFEMRGIKESDSIFALNLLDGKIRAWAVQEQKLVAKLPPYGPGSGFVSGDYMIGFELKSKLDRKFYLAGYLVYVGKENVFQEGDVRPVEWEELEEAAYPSVPVEAKDSLFKTMIGSRNHYRYSNNGLDYFIRTEGHSGISAQHLVVLDKHTKEVMLSKFYMDTEATYFKPLNGVEGHPDDMLQQWTGTIFRNGPPVVLGILGNSYGCETIDFIDGSGTSIVIRCDNRH